MNIEGIKVEEVNDGFFRLSFLFDGHALVTENLSKAMNKEDVAEAIKRSVTSFKELRAENNYSLIVEEFEGKTISIK